MKEPWPSKWHEKYFRSERIELLFDGVYAIVLTILVLDIKIPQLVDESSSAELWVATKKILPHLWSFLLTFLWIANSWVSGQSYMRLVTKIDAVVTWIMIFMLLLVCLFPFPTALIGEYPHNSLGVVYFGTITFLFGCLVTCLTQYTIRKNYISEHVDLADLKRKAGMIPKMMPIYLIPIAIAFWMPITAQVIYFALGVSWIFSTSSWKLKGSSEHN